MPYHQSPKKRLRRDTKRNLMNKSRLSALRTLLKKARAQCESESHVKAAQKALAIAASKGIIHPNAAARKIGRLMKKGHTQKMKTAASASASI